MAFEPARFEDGKQLLLAGLSESYTNATSMGIPAQWRRFEPYLGKIPGRIASRTTYGVLYDRDDASGAMEYLAGVEVGDCAQLPRELSCLKIPEHRYAVFAHRDPISQIRKTWMAIFREWLPKSAYRASDAPNFERYGEEFDPMTGDGGLEIWIAIKG